MNAIGQNNERERRRNPSCVFIECTYTYAGATVSSVVLIIKYRASITSDSDIQYFKSVHKIIECENFFLIW